MSTDFPDFDDESFDSGSGYDDGYGDDDGAVATETASRLRWPTLRQFNVFLENRVGRLHDLLRSIERHDLRVVALSLVDSVDFAVARVMLDDADRARELFELGDWSFFENDLIGVVLPDDPQPHLRLCLCLLAAEINIHYTYPINFRRGGQGTIAIHVEDVESSSQVLEDAGHELISESDLREDGLF